MGLHARERRKLRQLEEALRKEDPGLDTLLAGLPPPGRSALRHKTAVLGDISGAPGSFLALDSCCMSWRWSWAGWYFAR